LLALVRVVPLTVAQAAPAQVVNPNGAPIDRATPTKTDIPTIFLTPTPTETGTDTPTNIATGTPPTNTPTATATSIVIPTGTATVVTVVVEGVPITVFIPAAGRPPGRRLH
jgi:hypothetical protein